MANSTALSTSLTALAEAIAPGLDGHPVPTPAQLYRAILRARDEAVCLEARAGARDVAVHHLLGQVTTICKEAARFESLVTSAAARRAKFVNERTVP